MQNQREQTKEVLTEHVREAKAVSARTDAAASREHALVNQLSARGEEVAALRKQLALVAEEMETWRENGMALNAEVEARERTRDADAGKLAVMANKARMHEETAQVLRAQLAKMDARECAPCCCTPDGAGPAGAVVLQCFAGENVPTVELLTQWCT